MTTPASQPGQDSTPGDESRARFKKIVEATTDVVAMMDLTGRLLYVNIAGRRLFGWADDELAENRNLRDMQPSWALELVRQESIPTAIEIGYWSGETALNSSSGKEIPVLQVVLAHSGVDGHVEFLSTICRDISDRKQKELEQIEWANRYSAAIRASGQVLFDWDSSTGEITYAGDLCGLLGYGVEEMAGGLARLREVVVPEDLPGFDAAIEAVLLTRDPFQHEFRARRKNGLEIVINAQGYFFLDRLGRIGRMVGFLRDVTFERTAERAVQLANERLEERVTERTKALEKAAAQLQDKARQQEAVAKLGQVALSGTDILSLMQEAVEAVRAALHVDMTSVLEYSPGEGTFRLHAQAGWPTQEAPAFIRGGSNSQSGYTLLTGEPVVSRDFEKEERFTCSESVIKAGCRSGVSVSIQAGDRLLGVLCAFSKRPRDYSADEVNFLQSIANVLTAAIERSRADEETRRAQAQAEAADRAKSEFLSRMSHELRTPLNAILGFTQLLEMESPSPSQMESLQHITRAGQHLLALINEVLDIARIESGRMQFHIEPVEAAALCHEVASLSKPLAGRHEVRICIESPPSGKALVLADAERLKQVLLNLVSNAVKYNRQGGLVTLSFSGTAGGRLRINVTDTGLGIAEDRLAGVFLPFQRAAEHESGTGLGLMLSKRLISAMDGLIGATSTLGVGSTFWIELPTAPPGDSAESRTIAATPAATAQIPARRKVLYIEDDLANYHLLERVLKTRPEIELLPALQASIGLELAREHHPDMILLDLNLPDMSGEQVLRTLKAATVTADIPVIAVTGEASGEYVDVIRGLGAAEVLFKPYRLKELLALIDRALA